MMTTAAFVSCCLLLTNNIDPRNHVLIAGMKFLCFTRIYYFGVMGVNETEYLQRRIRDLIETSCDPTLSEKQRQNQREALQFHLIQMKSTRLPRKTNRDHTHL